LERAISKGFAGGVKKASDRLCRRIVLNVQQWKKEGNTLSFLADFLKYRSFKVFNIGFSSTDYVQENGVPQGSVLSLCCFLKDHTEEEFPGIDMVILTYTDDIAISITSEPKKSILTQNYLGKTNQ
jgi:hypothetical protein